MSAGVQCLHCVLLRLLCIAQQGPCCAQTSRQISANARLSAVQVGLAALSRVLRQGPATSSESTLAVAGFHWSAALKPALRRSSFFEGVLASGQGDRVAAADSRPSQPATTMTMPEVSRCRVRRV